MIAKPLKVVPVPRTYQELLDFVEDIENEFGTIYIQMDRIGAGSKWLVSTAGELCGCAECETDVRKLCDVSIFDVPMSFIVCTICGNKRCPKASSHRFMCTRSNEPGQIGQIEQEEK